MYFGLHNQIFIDANVIMTLSDELENSFTFAKLNSVYSDILTENLFFSVKPPGLYG